MNNKLDNGQKKIKCTDIITGNGKFIGSHFHLGYKIIQNSYIFSEKEERKIDKAVYMINWIILNTEYLQQIVKRKFCNISGRNVAARIKYAYLTTEIEIVENLKDTKGNPVLGLSIPNKNRIWLNSKRLQKSELDIARTIFHEVIHSLGFVHSRHEFINIFGELLKYYYDINSQKIQNEYHLFLKKRNKTGGVHTLTD